MNTFVKVVAGVAVAAVCANPARADIMYSLVVETVTSTILAGPAPAPTVSFDVSPGTAAVDEFGAGPSIGTTVISSTGSVSLIINGETESIGQAYGTVKFSTDGVNTSLLFWGEFTDLELTGNDSSVSGSYGTDEHGACDGDINTCSFTGYFVQTVPEPNTLLLFGAGLLGLGLVPRRTSRL